jgi:hypothetical protein
MRILRSRDNTVGIVTGYGLGDPRVGVRVSVRTRVLFSPHGPGRFWGLPSCASGGLSRRDQLHEVIITLWLPVQERLHYADLCQSQRP